MYHKAPGATVGTWSLQQPCYRQARTSEWTRPEEQATGQPQKSRSSYLCPSSTRDNGMMSLSSVHFLKTSSHSPSHRRLIQPSPTRKGLKVSKEVATLTWLGNLEEMRGLHLLPDYLDCVV